MLFFSRAFTVLGLFGFKDKHRHFRPPLPNPRGLSLPPEAEWAVPSTASEGKIPNEGNYIFLNHFLRRGLSCTT